MAIISALGLILGCSCVSLAAATGVECHASRDFLVAVKPFADQPGAQFAITALSGKSAPKACIFDADRADYLVGNGGDALWYQGQAGKYLMLERSSGPQSDLVVYDLEARKPVLDVPADGMSLNGTTLTFWQRGPSATAADCADFVRHAANGLESVISTKMLFDGLSGKLSATGDRRCDAVQ